MASSSSSAPFATIRLPNGNLLSLIPIESLPAISAAGLHNPYASTMHITNNNKDNSLKQSSSPFNRTKTLPFVAPAPPPPPAPTPLFSSPPTPLATIPEEVMPEQHVLASSNNSSRCSSMSSAADLGDGGDDLARRVAMLRLEQTRTGSVYH